MKGIKFLYLLVFILLLSACTSLPKDNGMNDVHKLLNKHGVNTEISGPENTAEIVENLIE